MPSHFFNPFTRYEDSTGFLSGAQLFFYKAGTNTKLDTYSDLALSNANSNPIVLNSLGQADVSIFLKPQLYKVVLAPATDSDPPSSPIWTVDDFHPSDFKSFPITTPSNGDPNGSVAGTAGSSGILPSMVMGVML